ncbi:acyl carrier protein [Candidatus Magnetomorum sp. HK-1]|nr:acyl carrier protein [Candidatus Magnetomorum sp. HK-1]
MTEKEVLDKFIAIIEEYVQIEREDLEKANRETNIISDLMVNSARLVDIIIKAEDTFDIEIDDDEADSIRTIGDAVDVVLKKLGE